MNIYGIGTLFPEYFNDGIDYFTEFISKHTPQILTESNKDALAYRKGIYLTDVHVENSLDIVDSKVETADHDVEVIDSKAETAGDMDSKEIHFKLLRCSTNLDGPTENFNDLDRYILRRVNETSKQIFDNPAPLNHVLAQVYYNCKVGSKDRKARIAKHSDKTKDMPSNGVMVFCTFYDKLTDKYRKDPEDKYNILYKNTSALTILRFELKKCASTMEQYAHLPRKFDVLLYPNSAFFMNLEMNRIFTHEIVPPLLGSSEIPTRLGYVIRCSKQDAKFVDNKTYIKNPENKWELLKKPSTDDISHIKILYQAENMSTDVIDYGFINFSLNDGDYRKPNL
jgi:hypothetical protein